MPVPVPVPVHRWYRTTTTTTRCRCRSRRVRAALARRWLLVPTQLITWNSTRPCVPVSYLERPYRTGARRRDRRAAAPTGTRRVAATGTAHVECRAHGRVGHACRTYWIKPVDVTPRSGSGESEYTQLLRTYAGDTSETPIMTSPEICSLVRFSYFALHRASTILQPIDFICVHSTLYTV